MADDERILAMLNAIHSEQKTTNERLTKLEADMTELKGDVAGLKGDVAGLKGDVAVLKGDVAVLKGDVAELKEDVAGLKEDVAGLKEDVAGLKATVAKIEVEHGAKLGALADGNKQLNDQYERLNERLSTQEEFVLRRVFMPSPSAQA